MIVFLTVKLTIYVDLFFTVEKRYKHHIDGFLLCSECSEMYLYVFYEDFPYVLIWAWILIVIWILLYFIIWPHFLWYKKAKIYIAWICFSLPVVYLLTFFSNRGVLELFWLKSERPLFLLLSFFAFSFWLAYISSLFSKKENDFWYDILKSSIAIPIILFLLQMPIHP